MLLRKSILVAPNRNCRVNVIVFDRTTPHVMYIKRGAINAASLILQECFSNMSVHVDLEYFSREECTLVENKALPG